MIQFKIIIFLTIRQIFYTISMYRPIKIDNNRTSSLFSFSQNKKMRGLLRHEGNVDTSNPQEKDHNDSYYETNTKQYNQSPVKKQEGISDLSLLIYQGLDQARKQVQKQRLLTNMENIYKKNIQLQIELCKELQKLTKISILFSSENEFKAKATQLEEEIMNLKKQMHQIQNKINAQIQTNTNVNPPKTKGQNFYRTPKQRKNFILSTDDKSKNRIRRKQHESQDEKSFNHNTFCEERSKNKVLKNRKYHESVNSNISPIPSRGTSIITGKKIGVATCSTAPNHEEDQKMLLFQRRNIIKAQVQMSRLNFVKKAEMMKSEIELLQEQIFIVEQCIQKYDNLLCKDSVSKHKYILSSEKSLTGQRNTRLKSYEKIRKSPKYKIFNFKSKTKSPITFLRAKAGSNSPLLIRCRSQNKLKSQMIYISPNLQLQQFKSSNNKSNLYGEGTHQENQYFEQSMNGLPAAKFTKINNSKAQNIYYS